MRGKELSIIIIAVCMLVFPYALWADVPAPPVNQSLGFDDTIFNNLVEAECRVCHDDPAITGPTSNVDRHVCWTLVFRDGSGPAGHESDMGSVVFRAAFASLVVAPLKL